MPHVDITCQQHGLHRLSQTEQAQQIARGGPGSTNRNSCLFVCQAKLIEQAAHTLCFLEGIEILSLYVFNQCHHRSMLICDVFD